MFPSLPASRQCNRCGVVKPLNTEHWHSHKSSPSGFRYACKPCTTAINAVWLAANKERKAATDAVWMAANKERKAAYRAANKERTAAASAAWRIAHPDRIRAKNHKRRTRISASGSYNLADIIELEQKQDNKCAYCQIPFSEALPS